MIDPNSVDMAEIIRECRRKNMTRVLTIESKEGIKDWCVIITNMHIGKAVMDFLTETGARRESGSADDLPTRGRN